MADDEDEIATRKRRETTSFQPIPDEIIFDILSKLPVRSLLRFKVVSKSWYSLISSSSFVQHHTKLSATCISRHAIIFKTFMSHSNIMCCPLLPVLCNQPTDAVCLDCCLGIVDLGDRDELFTVVGGCNGLACVLVEENRVDDRVFLLNPATRKCNKLPKPNAYSTEGSSVKSSYYGFGYDKSSNDYKVVAVMGVSTKERLPICHYLVEVYSWRTGCWKRIQDFPGDFPDGSRFKYVNGRLYEFGICLTSGQAGSILVSFDLATEVFAELPLPTASVRHLRYTKHLGALTDRLCVLYNYGRSVAEFWIMNENCAKECWTHFEPFLLSRNAGWIDSLFPLFVACPSEILMECDGSDGSCLALYDVLNHSFKHPEIRNADDAWEANIYIESLVAPNGTTSTR